MSKAPFEVEGDGWAKWGAMQKRFEHEGPGVQGAKALIQYTNSNSSFSTATTIMDIGCGSGSVIGELIAAYGPQIPKDARIIAADLSPGMIELVLKRLSQEPAWAKIDTAVYDIMNLSAVPDSSLSHVLSGFTIFLLPDPRKGLMEALRVLKPGAVFAFSSMSQNSWGSLMEKIADVRPDKKIPQPGPPWTTEEGVRGELEATGFNDIQTYSAPVYMPFEDPAEIVDYLWSTLPFMPMIIKDMTAEEKSQSRHLMVQGVKEKYPTQPGRLPGVAIIGVGKK